MAVKQPPGSIQFQWPAGAAESPRTMDGAQRSTTLPRSGFRRGLWWGSYLSAWCAVVVLTVAAAMQIFYHDGVLPLVWVSSFTRYVYLPAYLCVAWAAWQRRWVLLAAGSAVVACHVTWMVPDFVRDRRFDAPPRTAASASPTLRVFFANVAANNNEHQALLDEIAAADPDVVMLAEFSWPWHITFKTAPIMAPYKYGTGWLSSHIGSINVFSKLPLKLEQQDWSTGRPMHTVEIQLGTQTLRLTGLHGPRPVADPRYNYYGYWNVMLPKLMDERGPLVIVGDFNVTEHSRVYGQLAADRLRSAHDDRGRGWASTWPNGQYWLPPVRIDQVFVSPEIECVRIVEGEGRGSDHKPVIVDVRIREPAGASAVRSAE